MPLFALDNDLLDFPPPHLAEADGLLAMGGDLSPERLIRAYRQGIFPWYEGDHILWWFPDPRFVLFPDQLKISKGVKPLLNRMSSTLLSTRTFHRSFTIAGKSNEPDRTVPGSPTMWKKPI